MTKYIIRRTSSWYDEKPCEGAVQEELDCWDVRTASKAIMQADHPYDDYDDYEDFIASNGETWCRKSKKENYYTIDIDNLENFCNNIGEKIIIFPKDYDIELPYPVIEIYDTWRE
jgi:hypothetical protein